MLTPKFKVDLKETLHITEHHITNGHWLVERQAVTSSGPLAKAMSMNHGRYFLGEHSGPAADLTHILREPTEPKRKLNPAPVDVVWSSEMNIKAYVFETVGESPIRIAIDVDYVPLMQLGDAYITDNTSQVRLMRDDILTGIIMPMRM